MKIIIKIGKKLKKLVIRLWNVFGGELIKEKNEVRGIISKQNNGDSKNFAKIMKK